MGSGFKGLKVIGWEAIKLECWDAKKLRTLNLLSFQPPYFKPTKPLTPYWGISTDI
jgi:hypothetical protein